MPVRENIVLIGFMGSGKSTIGRMVAQRLAFRFVDTDRLIIERAGMPISDIFARDGEAHFRDLETSVLESLANLRHSVISTGGGVVVREGNRALLREAGFVVELTANPDVLFERVARNTKRPLLQTDDPRATVRELFTVRRPLYEATAHLRLDTSALSRSEAVERVCKAARTAFAWDEAT